MGEMEDLARILEAISGRPPDEAERLLEELCKDQPALRSEAQRLWRGGRAAPASRGEGLREGDSIDKYELVQALGRGGFGTVWAAWDRDVRRWVALKVLHPVASRRRARALAEAKASGSVRHECVVHVNFAGSSSDGGVAFVETDLCVEDESELGNRQRIPEIARSLARRAVDERGLPSYSVHESARIIAQLCGGLAALHSQGVIHRDIKPDNVLITSSGRPCLADFGLSLSRFTPEPSAAEDPPRSAPTELEDRRGWGTPPFMAPEQARGEDATPATDVYALGATLYFLLAGRAPYEARTRTGSTRDVRAEVIAGPPPTLGGLRPQLAPWLILICEHAMARSPVERYQSATDFGRDLELWLSNRVPSVVDATSAERLGLWYRRNRRLVQMGAVGASLAAIGAVLTLAAWVGRIRAQERLFAAEKESGDDAVRTESRRLALAAGVETDTARALELAVKSIDVTRNRGIARTPEAEQALRELLLPERAVPLPWHSGYLYTSHDGRWIASHDPAEAGIPVVQDLDGIARGGEPFALPEHIEGVVLLGFTEDGNWLVAVSQTGVVCRHPLGTPELHELVADVRTAEEPSHRSWSLSSDARWLVQRRSDGRHVLFDLESARPNENPTELDDGEATGQAPEFSPDSHYLVALRGKGGILVWDLALDPLSAVPRSIPLESEPVGEEVPARDYSLGLVGLQLSARNSFHGRGGFFEYHGADERSWLVDLRQNGLLPLELLLDGHRQSPKRVDPDGKWMLTAGKDEQLAYWNLTSADPREGRVVLASNDDSRTGWRIREDGRLFALFERGLPGRYELWSVGEDGVLKQTKAQPCPGGLDVLDFVPGAERLLLKSHSGVLTLALLDGEASWPVDNVYTLEHKFSPKGRWVLLWDELGRVHLHSVAAIQDLGKGRILEHGKGDRRPALHPDSLRWLTEDRLLAESEGGIPFLYELDPGPPRRAADPVHLPGSFDRDWPVQVAGDESGYWVFARPQYAPSSFGTLWRLEQGGGVRRVEVPGAEGDNWQWAFQAGPLLVARSMGNLDRLWVAGEGDEASPVKLPESPRGFLMERVSPDGQWLIGGADGTPSTLWRVHYGASPEIAAMPFESLPDALFRCSDCRGVHAAFDESGELLASSSARGELFVWRLVDQLGPELVARAESSGGHSLWLHPNGRLLTSTGSAGRIDLWAIDEAGLRPVRSGLARVNAGQAPLWLDAEGRWVLFQGDDGGLRLLNIRPERGEAEPQDLNMIVHQESPLLALFSMDSRWLVVCLEKSAHLWRLPPPDAAGTPLDEPALDVSGEKLSPSFSPESGWLALAGTEGGGKLYELDSTYGSAVERALALRPDADPTNLARMSFGGTSARQGGAPGALWLVAQDAGSGSWLLWDIAKGDLDAGPVAYAAPIGWSAQALLLPDLPALMLSDADGIRLHSLELEHLIALARGRTKRAPE